MERTTTTVSTKGQVILPKAIRDQREAPALLASALSWMDDGMDFADAMHLAAAEGCDAFLTFDRKLARSATGRSSVPVDLL